MKPGIKTSEFWIVVVANVLTQAGALDVPERYRWLITLATVTGHALSRGFAKAAATDASRGSSSGDASRAAAPTSTRDVSARQATP